MKKLALPRKPNVMIRLTIYLEIDDLKPLYPLAHRVKRKYGQPGGGREFWTSHPIPFWSRFPEVAPLF